MGSRTIKSLSIQKNYQPLNNAVLFSTNCRRFKEHEFTTRLTEDKTIKDQFHIRDLCNFGEKTPLEKIKNFNYVLNDEHINYLTFCLYSELLSRYLFPYLSKWVTDGVGFMDKNTRTDRDTEFCEFIMKHWKSVPENLPLPPKLVGYDYCSKKYRIRILADKRQIIHSLNYEVDYDMIRQPTTKSPPSLHTLLACVRNFPWSHVIESEEGKNQYKMLMRTFHSSTDYFTFEKNTISNALLLDPESAHSKFLTMFAKFSTKS